MGELHSASSCLEKSESTKFCIDGAVNFRSFAGYSSTVSQGAVTREGFIYRSGNLSNITNKGWEQMRELNISTIICLTNKSEADALYANAQCSEKVKYFKKLNFSFYQEEFNKTNLVAKYSRYASEGHTATAQDYMALLRKGPTIIRDILLQVLDYPDEVFLIHCSMGKDRTGIVFAILLSLAGVSEETVSEEYSLSESALEPLLPKILALVKEIAPCGSSEPYCRRIALQSINSSKATMHLTLQMVETEFGGVIRYVKEHCGFSTEEVELIRHNLIIKRNRK